MHLHKCETSHRECVVRYDWGMAALTDKEIAEGLRDLPGWRHEEGEIFKWFTFPGFPEAIGFL